MATRLQGSQGSARSDNGDGRGYVFSKIELCLKQPVGCRASERSESSAPNAMDQPRLREFSKISDSRWEPDDAQQLPQTAPP